MLIATAAGFLFQARQKPAANGPAKADRILVEKTARRLTLFSAGRRLKEYRVALGFSPVGAKQREGDGRTPSGSYGFSFFFGVDAAPAELGADGAVEQDEGRSGLRPRRAEAGGRSIERVAILRALW